MPEEASVGVTSRPVALLGVTAVLVGGLATASTPVRAQVVPDQLPAPVVVAQASPSPDQSPAPGASTATPAPDATPAMAVPDHLARELGAVLARYPSLVEAGEVGISVMAGDGAPVWSTEADLPLLPASSMKALTAASVLATFGEDGRITTAANGTVAVRGDGVLDGDLVVRGLGDPTMTSDDYRRWVYPARPATAIEDLADRIVASGVRRVTGDLVGDGTVFGVARTAAGWPSRYFDDFDAHYLSGLTIDTGRRVEVDAPPGQAASVVIDHAPDPALRTTEVLARALVDRGVRLDGRVRRTIKPVLAFHPVATVSSPPMSEVVAFMLAESDNHLADTLLRASAVRDRGRGTWADGGATLRAALQAEGVDTAGLVASDGSGLSRADRVTANQLVANDRAMVDHLGRRWSDLLAVAGEVGTLENRLVGTPAQGRLFAKTGTLADVRAVAGHVVGPDGPGQGDRYHFAIIANDVEPVRYVASVMADEIALVLTDALDGCRRRRGTEVEVTPSEPTGPSAAPGTGPEPAPTPRLVRRPVTASPGNPGPALSDGDWDRRCPAA